MGFTTGAKLLADIVDEIAEGLITSTDPETGLNYWSDADTSWNTSNRLEQNAKRALKYENGDELVYITVEAVNSQINSYPGHYSRGLRIVFSASWDDINHIYPSSNQSTYIPFENHNTTVLANLTTLMITYYLWIDHTGFVIMAKPEPTGDNQQQSFMACVEHSKSKEYADGYTNFFCYAVCNIWPELYGGDYAPLNRNRSILRPFAYQWPNGGGNQGAPNPNGNGISFVPMPSYYAFKSIVSNKVYYIKPIIHNIAGQTAAAFQSDMFFMWTENLGLIDGDIISMEGRTTKYLCKGLSSPDSTSRLTYAIKYVA